MRFINLELFKIASQDIFDGILGKRAHRRSEIFSRNKRQNKSWSQSVISRREAQKGEPHRRHSTGPVPGSVSSA